MQKIKAGWSLEKSSDSNTEAQFGERTCLDSPRKVVAELRLRIQYTTLLHPGWCLLPPNLNSPSHAQTTGASTPPEKRTSQGQLEKEGQEAVVRGVDSVREGPSGAL